MALHRYVINYQPRPPVLLPEAGSVIFGICYMRVPFDGATLKRVQVWTANTIESSIGGGAVFNVRINSVAQWSGDSRLIIVDGETTDEKADLNIALTKGDKIFLDLENNPRSSNVTPITVVFEIDDGSSGGEINAEDLSEILVFSDNVMVEVFGDQMIVNVPERLAYDDLQNLLNGDAPTIEKIQDIVGTMFETGTNISFNYNDATGKLELDAIQLTTEEVQDKIGALLSGGANTTVTYNDGANTLTIAETTAGKTTEEIQDIVGALLTQGSNVTLTYDDSGNTLTIAATGGGGGGTLAGDVTGAIGTNTVAKIQNRAVYIPAAPSGFYGDNFNDNSLHLSRFVFHKSGGVSVDASETSGKLRAYSNEAGSFGLAGIKGITTINLTDRYIQIKLTSLGASAKPSFYFGIFNGNASGDTFTAGQAVGSSIGFTSGVSGISPPADGIYPAYTVLGINGFGTPFTGFLADNTYYRLEHNSTDGYFYFKTSTNGTTWTTRHSVLLSSLAGFDFTAVKIAVLGGQFDSAGAPSTMTFDDLMSNLYEDDSLTDKSLLWYKSSTQQFEKVSLADLKAALGNNYEINVQCLTFSPADSVTNYFGLLAKAPVATAGQSKIYFRRAGIIRAAEIYCYSGTAGTAESWSLYVRKNNTTDYLISTVAAATAERVFSNTALNSGAGIAIADGDYVEMKMVNPAWATNPLTTHFAGRLFVE